jgi:hypothetical protein
VTYYSIQGEGRSANDKLSKLFDKAMPIKSSGYIITLRAVTSIIGNAHINVQVILIFGRPLNDVNFLARGGDSRIPLMRSYIRVYTADAATWEVTVNGDGAWTDLVGYYQTETLTADVMDIGVTMAQAQLLQASVSQKPMQDVVGLLAYYTDLMYDEKVAVGSLDPQVFSKFVFSAMTHNMTWAVWTGSVWARGGAEDKRQYLRWLLDHEVGAHTVVTTIGTTALTTSPMYNRSILPADTDTMSFGKLKQATEAGMKPFLDPIVDGMTGVGRAYYDVGVGYRQGSDPIDDDYYSRVHYKAITVGEQPPKIPSSLKTKATCWRVAASGGNTSVSMYLNEVSSSYVIDTYSPLPTDWDNIKVKGVKPDGSHVFGSGHVVSRNGVNLHGHIRIDATLTGLPTLYSTVTLDYLGKHLSTFDLNTGVAHATAAALVGTDLTVTFKDASGTAVDWSNDVDSIALSVEWLNGTVYENADLAPASTTATTATYDLSSYSGETITRWIELWTGVLALGPASLAIP